MPKDNFQLERIRELIAIMRESGVTELSVELPDFKISLKREGIGAEEEAPVFAVEPEPRAAGEAPESFPVVAPMVGIFRAATDHSAKVSPGDTVAVGQVIGAIEVMKVPNDVLSPVGGVAREVLAADGAAVEYGQPLMLIQPLAAAEGVEIEAEAI
ncbi:MAG: hypothetical protein JSV65_11890 [Armatimonadota bacterium]|nr:MAG: hypothetical protein JSV65_11890 [Armatimonadota bacterium]